MIATKATAAAIPPRSGSELDMRPPENNCTVLENEPLAAHDRRMVESIRAALRASGYLMLRDVVTSLQNEMFVLEGVVPNYYQKQLAQKIAQRLAGGRKIANSIEVTRSS